MNESRSSPGTNRDPQPTDGNRRPDEAQREKVQKQLDEALAATFPASDPVSMVTSHQEEDWGET